MTSHVIDASDPVESRDDDGFPESSESPPLSLTDNSGFNYGWVVPVAVVGFSMLVVGSCLAWYAWHDRRRTRRMYKMTPSFLRHQSGDGVRCSIRSTTPLRRPSTDSITSQRDYVPRLGKISESPEDRLAAVVMQKFGGDDDVFSPEDPNDDSLASTVSAVRFVPALGAYVPTLKDHRRVSELSHAYSYPNLVLRPSVQYSPYQLTWVSPTPERVVRSDPNILESSMSAHASRISSNATDDAVSYSYKSPYHPNYNTPTGSEGESVPVPPHALINSIRSWLGGEVDRTTSTSTRAMIHHSSQRAYRKSVSMQATVNRSMDARDAVRRGSESWGGADRMAKLSHRPPPGRVYSAYRRGPPYVISDLPYAVSAAAAAAATGTYQAYGRHAFQPDVDPGGPTDHQPGWDPHHSGPSSGNASLIPNVGSSNTSASQAGWQGNVAVRGSNTSMLAHLDSSENTQNSISTATIESSSMSGGYYGRGHSTSLGTSTQPSSNTSPTAANPRALPKTMTGESHQDNTDRSVASDITVTTVLPGKGQPAHMGTHHKVDNSGSQFYMLNPDQDSAEATIRHPESTGPLPPQALIPNHVAPSPPRRISSGSTWRSVSLSESYYTRSPTERQPIPATPGSELQHSLPGPLAQFHGKAGVRLSSAGSYDWDSYPFYTPVSGSSEARQDTLVQESYVGAAPNTQLFTDTGPYNTVQTGSIPVSGVPATGPFLVTTKAPILGEAQYWV